MRERIDLYNLYAYLNCTDFPDPIKVTKNPIPIEEVKALSFSILKLGFCPPNTSGENASQMFCISPNIISYLSVEKVETK